MAFRSSQRVLLRGSANFGKWALANYYDSGAIQSAMPCAADNCWPLTLDPIVGNRSLMSSTATPVSPSALFRQSSFVCFLLSRSLSRFSSQIAAVAIGWQVYDLSGSAFDLGMVGLVQFLPTALLVFVAGHAADRFERKRVVQVCQLAEALTALFLGWGSARTFLSQRVSVQVISGAEGTAVLKAPWSCRGARKDLAEIDAG